MANESDRTPARTDEDPTQERLVAEVVLNRRRRYVLYYLSERSGPVSVVDLALQVATWERSTMPDELTNAAGVTTAHEESVYSSIRRSHIPYLESRGYATYDSHGDRVTGQVDDPTMELYVANEPRTTVAWHEVYLVLTFVSALLLGSIQVDSPPFGELRPLAMAAVIVALYAAASVGYWYDVYRWRRRTEESPPDFLVSMEEELPSLYEESPYEGEEDDRNEGDGVE